MALALADILSNASNDSETDVTLVIPTAGQVTATAPPILPHLCQKIRINSSNMNEKTRLQMIYGIVKLYLNLFNQANCQGVILLVYSVICTRGVDKIRSDMDLVGNTLLNEHGYAS